MKYSIARSMLRRRYHSHILKSFILPLHLTLFAISTSVEHKKRNSRFSNRQEYTHLKSIVRHHHCFNLITNGSHRTVFHIFMQKIRQHHTVKLLLLRTFVIDERVQIYFVTFTFFFLLFLSL